MEQVKIELAWSNAAISAMRDGGRRFMMAVPARK